MSSFTNFFIDLWDDINPKKQPNSNDKVRGLMVTDWGQMNDLVKYRRDDCKKWRSKQINTMYFVADLPINQPGQRMYVKEGRKLQSVTNLLEDNIKRIYNWGFRIMITLENEPSVRKGRGPWMAGTGYKNMSGKQLYTNERLEYAKNYFSDLFRRVGMRRIWGIVLCLETMEPVSIEWQRKLGAWLRSIGYNGRLYTNGIASASWAGDPSLDIRSTTGTAIRLLNGDGQELNANNAANEVPKWINLGNRYQDGWLMYISVYIGKQPDRTKPSKLEKWMYEYII